MTAEPQDGAVVHEHAYISDREMLSRLALAIGDTLESALHDRGTACLAVSGGRSPITLFEVLRERTLNWSKVIITLVDERCVPPEHADSNARLVRQNLLRGRAVAAHFVPLIETMSSDEVVDPDALARKANARLADLPRLDIAVLGMGDDGHTASWFPGGQGLAQAVAMPGKATHITHRRPILDCKAVIPATAPHPRLTLTLPAVLASRQLALQFAGAAKHAVYQQALRNASLEYPVSLLLHQTSAPVDVWIAH
jgi:6-phosphogluconolactonase